MQAEHRRVLYWMFTFVQLCSHFKVIYLFFALPEKCSFTSEFSFVYFRSTLFLAKILASVNLVLLFRSTPSIVSLLIWLPVNDHHVGSKEEEFSRET